MRKLIAKLGTAFRAYREATRHEHEYDPETGMCDCGKGAGGW
jgi:hypothetical protein